MSHATHRWSATQRPRTRKRPYLPLVLVLVSLLVAACGGGTSGAGSGSGASGAGDVLAGSDMDGVPSELAHVHGIGENAADGAVYIATHFGLWRMKDGTEPERVGNNAHDFMGFSIVGPDHFIASGHPNGAPELPSHLGLIETKDAGETWRSVSLLGEADFHTLRAASGRTYGVNAGNLMVTGDQRNWDTVARNIGVIDLVADPDDAERLLASIAVSDTELEVRTSDDGGSSFTTVEDAPRLVRLAWNDPGETWGVDIGGDAWVSADGGSNWKRAGAVGGIPEAFADSGDALLAAVNGQIVRSTDGKDWRELYKYGESGG